MEQWWNVIDRFFPLAISPAVRQTPGFNSQRRGTAFTLLNQAIIFTPLIVFFIWPSLHNNVVQCFYYATINWATCFDSTGPSSGL